MRPRRRYLVFSHPPLVGGARQLLGPVLARDQEGATVLAWQTWGPPPPQRVGCPGGYEIVPWSRAPAWARRVAVELNPALSELYP